MRRMALPSPASFAASSAESVLGSLSRRVISLIAVEAAHIRLGGDDGHDHRLSERGFADGQELELRRLGVELLEIGLDLAIIGELAVGADPVAEEGLGGRLGPGRKTGQGRDDRKGRELPGKRAKEHGNLLRSERSPFSIIRPWRLSRQRRRKVSPSPPSRSPSTSASSRAGPTVPGPSGGWGAVRSFPGASGGPGRPQR